jgi:hypothetical protein
MRLNINGNNTFLPLNMRFNCVSFFSKAASYPKIIKTFANNNL